MRGQADIVIDDVVTGTFHTTSLEALAQGKATIAFLDSRTQLVLSELAQSTDLPIDNAHLEQLEKLLERLCASPQLVDEIGSFALAWMQTFYREEQMVAHYVRGYDQLLSTGQLSNPRYNAHASAKQFLYREVPDMLWDSRRKSLYSGMIGHKLNRTWHRLRQGSLERANDALEREREQRNAR